MSRLGRDERGTSFVEFTVVFPLTILVILGTVDASLLVFDWSSATKATYAGARTAIVSDPVASAARFTLASYTTQSTYSGRYCYNAANGNADGTAACPTVNVTCKGDNTGTGGSCTSGDFNKAAFDAIFNQVQAAYGFRSLDRRQVQVTYATTNLGFVGQQSFDGSSGELPMNVTVELRCITHQFFFVNALMRWTFSSLPAGCAGVPAPDGVIMPPFTTTLPSEDLTSN